MDASPTIELIPPRIYSTNGVVSVLGEVDRPARVIVDVLLAQTNEYEGGVTRFGAEVVRDPGEYEIEVVATTPSGNEATELLQIIVDPDLETELAFIQDLDPSESVLTADYVQWLTGDEAVEAARDDGYIGADEDLPGDFYIRNENPELRSLTFTDDPVIVLIACYPNEGPCVTLESVDVNKWSQVRADPDNALERLGWQWYGLGELPYWLTLRDGVIVQVIEQYLP